MAVPNALIDSSITDRLGATGVSQLRESLWPADCQLCGRPLGTKPAAVAVDDTLVDTTASLFHPRCRASEWNDSGGTTIGSGALLSWTTRALALPFQRGDSQTLEPMPLMVVNPGLEIVSLKQSPLGVWSVAFNDLYSEHLKPPGEGLIIDKAVTGWNARLIGSTLTVSSGFALSFSMTVNAELAGMVTDLGGAMLVLTHAVNPADITQNAQMEPVLRGDRSLFGWVALA